MTRKHISRKYSAHKHSVLRPEDEYFAVEIYSYDHKDTVVYSKYDYDYAGTDNVREVKHQNWLCLEAEVDTRRFSIDCNYVVDEFAEYRFDCLYEKKQPVLNTSQFIIFNSKGEEVYREDFLCDGDTDNTKRKSFFVELKPDTYTIRYRMTVNTWFYGAISRKLIRFFGDSLDSAGTNMMVSSASVSHTGAVKPAELSLNIAYDDAFECKYSPSGFYMDYRDEINCYVRDEDDIVTQIFGGYLSSIIPNDNHTSLTVTGVDRLSDGDKKYIMEAMVLKGGDKELGDYQGAMQHSFDTYGAALQHLCMLCEETINNNVNENFFVAGENYSEGMTATFGKNQTISNVVTSNMKAEMSDNFVTIRNNPKGDSQQMAYLYDISTYGNGRIDITDFPNFYFTYGLGDPKTEVK